MIGKGFGGGGKQISEGFEEDDEKFGQLLCNLLYLRVLFVKGLV
jgi:hypothetical protein